MKLGCIADDFTGATDLAGLLRRSGASVQLHLGMPTPGTKASADIEIVALKCRTEAVEKAVADCSRAADWLLANGAEYLYWKYCSTFDSTPQGNIGPVAEALMQKAGKAHALYCPAFPENGRSVFMGHLFVGQQLLSESSLKDHPLTPMTDANLARVLQPQVAESVGIYSRLDQQAGTGMPDTTHVIGDAVELADLKHLVDGALDSHLLTGGSALAMFIPEKLGLATDKPRQLPSTHTKSVILSGSCSAMTRRQVAEFSGPKRVIDALHLTDADMAEHLAWWQDQTDTALLYATAEPERVKAVQAKLGREAAGAAVEAAMAWLATHMAAQGVSRFVVAGGETSGIVASTLAVSKVMVGAEIVPGVPWVFGEYAGRNIALALKSGNFGGPDFFAQALDVIDHA